MIPHQPFPEDYADPRGEKEIREERTEIEEQVRLLAGLSADRQQREADVEVLRKRRERRGDLVQFEAIEHDGSTVLVVSGQLLIRREDLTDEVRDRLAREFDLEVSTVPGLGGDVLQLNEANVPGEPKVRGRTEEVARQLLAEKIKVSLSYLTPLGQIRKGQGGPEPSAGARVFPPVVVAGAGAPARVAVIDTGISTELRTDNWLQGLLRSDNVDELDQIPLPNKLLDAGAGHGSLVAGVVQQVAPTAHLRIYRVMDTDGCASEAQVAAAMLGAVDDGAQILNLSLGTDTLDDQAPLTLRAAVERIRHDHPDVLIVAAAGNYADTRHCWPAAFAAEYPETVVAVAGLDPSGGPSDWSSRGDWVTCSAIGEGVVSTYVVGEEDPLFDPRPDRFGENSWAASIGTSFAAPQIVGGIARKMQENNQTPHAALAELLNGAPQDLEWGRMVKILPGT